MVALAEGDLENLAVHAALHRHRVERGDGSQSAQIDGDIPVFHGGYNNGDRANGSAFLVRGGRRNLGAASPGIADHDQNYEQ
jgi:hypothetical protein